MRNMNCNESSTMTMLVSRKMSTIKRFVVVLAVACLGSVLCNDLSAQGFRGDFMENIPGRPGEWILKGHVEIVSQGNKTYSDYAEYNQNTQSSVAYGNLRIYTKEKVKITGKKLIYDGIKQVYNVIENVVLEDGKITMKTPELEFFGSKNSAVYEKGGIMISGETVLKSKRGDYDGATQMFHCYNDVVIVNPNYTIWTDTLHYNRSGLAKFYGPTNIETNDYYMYSLQGWFNQEKSTVSLKDSAYVKTKETQILYGDSIYYDLAKKKGDVHRNVFLKDTARNCFVKSDFAKNDEVKGYAFFSQNPRAVLVQAESDSLFIVSDTMIVTYRTDTSYGKNEKKLNDIFANKNVRFYKKDIQGKCDYMEYFQRDSLMYMLKDPVVWLGEYQIDGDTIRMWFKNQKPERTRVNANVFIASRVGFYKEDTVTKKAASSVDIGEWFNQIKGKEMWGYFDDSSNFKMADVTGRAEAIYYVVDDEKNELIGVNKSLSKRIKMYFNNSEIQGVNLIEPEKTAMYPEPQMTQREKILKGFHWLSGLRPRSKYDLSLDW